MWTVALHFIHNSSWFQSNEFGNGGSQRKIYDYCYSSEFYCVAKNFLNSFGFGSPQKALDERVPFNILIVFSRLGSGIKMKTSWQLS